METITFEDFLLGVDPFVESFVVPMHKSLTEKGYKIEIKPAAQGPVVSYKTPKTKKTVFNYVFRKNGMQVRIYGDNVHKYQAYLKTIPVSMTKAIDKAGECRLCNSRCPKGYPVLIDGIESIKCRYGAFMFLLSPETALPIKAFLEHEISER